MEPKELAQEGYNLFEPRVNRASVHFESLCKVEDGLNLDPIISLSLSADTSVPSFETRTPILDAKPFDAAKHPASGPQRAKNSAASSSKRDKEKRKRSRVTPEQLVHLEQLFSTERSPTAARRKEISERLGMHERQTQIWFQNRRAKAKLLDVKHKGRSGSAEILPDTPPELSTGFEVDLHNLIHEDEPVTIIPCTDLSIGTWRRIASTVGKHDLVAYVCETKRCLTWFIRSAGYGFKMEIPFDIIRETKFGNATPGSGLASFILSKPPMFYLEHFSSAASDGTVMRDWKQCSDWTEGLQATKVLRHDLIGSAVQLAHLLRTLQDGGSDVTLHQPSYGSTAKVSPSSLDFDSEPSGASSVGGYYYRHETPGSSSPQQYVEPCKRSESVSTPSLASPFSGMDRDPHSSSPFLTHAQHEAARTSQPYVQPSPTPFRQSQPSSHDDHDFDDYDSVALSLSLAPRPFAAQPVPRTFYDDGIHFVPVSHRNDIEWQQPHSLTSHQIGTSPPPLLTTPYHPRLENLEGGHPGYIPMAAAISSGLPGVSYEPEDTQLGLNPQSRR